MRAAGTGTAGICRQLSFDNRELIRMMVEEKPDMPSTALAHLANHTLLRAGESYKM
jgi:hypothetical protein